MRHIIRNLCLCAGLLVLALGSIYPPGERLRLGKDLRGGTTLVYAINTGGSAEPSEVIGQTITVLKDRIDPTGALEVQMVAQGSDRIEVSMPLPSEESRALRAAFEAELEKLGEAQIDAGEVERAMRASGAERAAAFAAIAQGDGAKAGRLDAAAAHYDRGQRLRAEYQSRVAGGESPESEGLSGLIGEIASAELAYEAARDELLSAGLDPRRLRRALELPDEPRELEDESVPETAARSDRYVTIPGQRTRALSEIRAEFPAFAGQIDRVAAAYGAYTARRVGLDDTEELKRLLQASGVPSFRITVDPQGQNAGAGNEHPEEARLRAELAENGPRNVRSRDTVWARLNNIERWYETKGELEALSADPAGFFAARGYVVEPWNGDYWMLCWDTRDKRLTQRDGRWSIARAYRTQDQTGFPAIGFEMDAAGSVRLGELTGPNLGRRMAVLLDEQVYTAPNLNGAISSRGVIESGGGGFRPEEIEYIVKVLTAGSLRARLSPEPLSESTIAPEFGLDNLELGRRAGLIALAAVSAFMVFYYFWYGAIAVVSLLFTAVLIVASMAVAHQPFSLPGIAGVILTFGMAVDANVLIYERIREELLAGENLRAAARIGYKKAMSSIVDGNVTNLIVCFVLGNPALGTQEIRGFAITLGIGVVCTMFSALVVARLLLHFFADTMKVRKMSMLPLAVPAVERALSPRVNWMGLRWTFVVISGAYLALGAAMIVRQGAGMFDTEFRGGTQVEVRLRAARPGEAEYAEGGSTRITRSRRDIEEPIRSAGEGRGPQDPLSALRNAEVVPINPVEGVISDRFRIKTYATDTEGVLSTIAESLGDVLEARPALTFAGSERAEPARLARPVLHRALGESIDRPGIRNDATAFLGGAAVVLEGIDPPTPVASIAERIEATRAGSDFADTLGRTVDYVVIEGTPEAATGVVMLVRQDGLAYFDNQRAWETDLAGREWTLAREALGNASVSASVQSFSPVVAEGFSQQAVVSVAASLLLILLYVWVRFGSARYSIAAIAALAHDVLATIGLIAVAEIVYENAFTSPFAQALLIQPFKIDLNLVAAILTIIGYSLNDTIIIMDRIRENRGRLPYASRDVINQSINQTISRTAITSGTTILATLVLYIFGGDGVRAFSYALLVGVLVGTYSSVAVAAPLVWSRRSGTHPGRAGPTLAAGAAAGAGAISGGGSSAPRLP